MEALVWLGENQLAVEDMPDPKPAPDEVVVDIDLAGICGSDLHAYRGAASKRRPPLVLGHEAVVRVRDDAQRFVVFPLSGCGACAACKAGSENLCPDRRLLGLDGPGTLATQVAVRESALLPVPETLSSEIAALTEPLAAGVRALRDHPDGANLVVIGCGPIGLLTVFAAASKGSRVISVDPVDSRRAVARALGVEAAFADATDLPQNWATSCIDAVGVESTWTAGLRCVVRGGAVTVLGLAQSSGTVPVGEMVRNGLTLRGSYAYTRQDFDEALKLLSERRVPTGWLRVLSLAEGDRAFAGLVNSPQEFIKVLLHP
jgi:L-iditol 2-dehydrogenase